MSRLDMQTAWHTGLQPGFLEVGDDGFDRLSPMGGRGNFLTRYGLGDPNSRFQAEPLTEADPAAQPVVPIHPPVDQVRKGARGCGVRARARGVRSRRR